MSSYLSITYCVYIFVTVFIYIQADVNNLLIVKCNEDGPCNVETDILKHFTKVGNKYYHIEYDRLVNWFVAHQICRSYNAHLASFETEEEFNELDKWLRPIERTWAMWISYNDLATEGDFYSSTTGRKPTVYNWNAGEPNNFHEEDCINLNNRNQMNDEPCEWNRGYICEISSPKRISITVR